MHRVLSRTAAVLLVAAALAAGCARADGPDAMTTGAERVAEENPWVPSGSPTGDDPTPHGSAATDGSDPLGSADSTPGDDSGLRSSDSGAVTTTTALGSPAVSTTSTPSGPTTTVTSTTVPDTTVPSTTSAPPSTTTVPTTTTGPSPGCCGEGNLGIYVMAKTAFNPWTNGGHWAWMNQHYESMVVWEPYWDSRLASFDDVTVYRDSYAIKTDPAKDPRYGDHPDWVLHDAGGSPAYIPFGCSSGCPQYAADIGNQEFRDDWIAAVQTYVDKGYTGLFIDDVNYLWRFGDVNGDAIEPIDPRTGDVLTLGDWQLYMTEFLEQVRAAFPQIEIWHNAIWYSDSPGFSNSLINRQIRAADVVQLERGMNDKGLKTGTSKFGMQTFMAFIDRVHANGANVALLDENAVDAQGQWYNIAGGLLVNDGGDLVTTEDWDLISPTGLFAGYLTDLGHALGPRQVVDATIQREFTGGLVVMNEPRSDPVTVDLGGTWLTPEGATVTSITLDSREAIVLTRP